MPGEWYESPRERQYERSVFRHLALPPKEGRPVPLFCSPIYACIRFHRRRHSRASTSSSYHLQPPQKCTERMKGIPPHLLGCRHRFVLPRGAATISILKIKKEADDDRTMDHSILPLLPLTRHSSHLFFTSSFISRSYFSGAYRSSALE